MADRRKFPIPVAAATVTILVPDGWDDDEVQTAHDRVAEIFKLRLERFQQDMRIQNVEVVVEMEA